jgi:hypothetical protein
MRRPTSSGCCGRCFEAITQQVVAAAQEQAAVSPDGMLSPRLGLFLDEAGNCAALSDLDVLATTARGQGIQLVTVWHDKSQLEARYGPKAYTILNNHRAKLFLSGLADLSALELGARLIGDQALTERNRSMGSDGRHALNESTQYRPLLPVEDLRRLRPGEGVLLYGHLHPVPIRLRPFYTPREQHRRERAEQRAAQRLARAQRRLGRKAERAFIRIQRRHDRTQAQRAVARVVWPAREGAGDDPQGASGWHPRQPTGPRAADGPAAGAGAGRLHLARPRGRRRPARRPHRAGPRGQGGARPGPRPAAVAARPAGPDLGLAELRARLVRDRITDAYLRRELAGDGRLDPSELAGEVGTSPAVARQWLAGLRAQHTTPQGLEVLSEPISHGHPSPEQLAGLQAHFAAAGYQQAAVTGRPANPERLAAEVERRYWTREVRGGQRLRPLRLARELGGDRRQISQQLAELRAGPSTAGERIAQLWHAQQQDPAARPLRSSQLAWRLGVSDSYVRHRTWQLRTRNGQPPLGERLAATRQQLASPPPPVGRSDGERDWRLDAACAEVEPELFFPETGRVPQAALAKQVCAGCAVRGPCLQAALHGPQARDDHSGIFAGTTARERVRLRGRASYAEGTRFVYDRTAAEAALALANEKRIDRAARQLGVSKQALRRAFDHHGLSQPAVFQGGPRRTRFYDDRDAAEQAWRRAAKVGINQTRKELGVSDRALRTAWQRHGLGLPPRPTSTSGTGTRRLDAAFLQLNRRLLPARARSDTELAARVRRAEEYAVFGADVVVEMGSETYGKRPAARAWAITRRAQRAHRRTSDRQHRDQRRQADRASRSDRTSRSPSHPKEREVAADAR